MTLLDLLSDYTDALNRSEDPGAFDTDAWLARYPVSASPFGSLASLLRLIRALRQALQPMQPSPLFRAELRDQLQAGGWAAERPYRRVGWRKVAIIGSVLGLLLWRSRRLRSGMAEPLIRHP